MNTLVDLAVNLLAAGIGFAIAQAIATIRRANKYRRARKFWRPFVNGDFVLYLACMNPKAE